MTGMGFVGATQASLFQHNQQGGGFHFHISKERKAVGSPWKMPGTLSIPELWHM